MKVLEKFKGLKLLFINEEKEKEIKLKVKVPEGTDYIIDIENIIVPKKLLYSRPRKTKYNTYFDLFKKYGCIDKPILVARDNTYRDSPFVVLKDQYIRWLICKNNGIKQVPVRFVEE